MNKEDKKILMGLRRNLRQIQETGTAPINLTKYTRLGLVKKRYTHYTYQGKKRKRLKGLVLTPKARRLLVAEL